MFPSFSQDEIPQFTAAQVWKKLASMKSKMSSREGDVPSKLLKIFAAYLVEVVPEIKLLGTIICNDLTWDSNTANIVKRAHARMILLRKLSEFGAPREHLKTIYILYIRSVLEQSAVVWHSSLTQQNTEDLNRVQKSACKIM